MSNYNSNANAGASLMPQREPNYVGIDDEIERLADCVLQLEDLIERVNNGGAPVKGIAPPSPRPVRSLLDVLTNGADRIRNSRMVLSERIQQLESMLF